MAKTTLRLVLTLTALFVTLIVFVVSVILYRVISKPPPAFLTTSSPKNTYTVFVTGQKERPRFFMVEVQFHVSKNGKPFLANEYLHSGDSEDMSFQMGYPNQRWISENAIQFYREEDFSNRPDTLVVMNSTAQTIKYAKIESVDKVLLFDLQPGSTTKIATPRPRGDLKYLAVVGEFSEGEKIVDTHSDLNYPKHLLGPNTYYVYINRDRSVFELHN